MPELVPTWEALCERAGGGDLAARVLSLFDPPPLLAGCSQAVIDGALVRNYDYHPDRIEGTVLAQRDHAARARDERLPVGPARRRQRRRAWRSRWRSAAATRAGRVRDHARRPLPARDLRHGRAGGRDARPPARPRALQPHAGGRAGDAATVFVGPDRAARAVLPAVATNHQEHVDWPEHAARRARRAPRRALLTRPTRALPGSRRCTRPSSRAASARSTPRSTARSRAGRPTAGRARAGTSRCAPLRPARGPSDSADEEPRARRLGEPAPVLRADELRAGLGVPALAPAAAPPHQPRADQLGRADDADAAEPAEHARAVHVVVVADRPDLLEPPPPAGGGSGPARRGARRRPVHCAPATASRARSRRCCSPTSRSGSRTASCARTAASSATRAATTRATRSTCCRSTASRRRGRSSCARTRAGG